LNNIISGIYCIENLENGMRYVGASKNIDKRFSNHFYKLKIGHHENMYLQEDWNRLSNENFSFYLIEECDIQNLNNLEMFYIENLKTKYPNGYNLTEGGKGSVGWNPTPEQRKKSSESQTGLHAGEKNPMFGISPRERMDDETYVNWKEKHRQNAIGEKNPNFGNRKLSKIYAEDHEYAKEKQSRPGIKNGRATPIAMFNNENFYLEFDYMSLCAEYLVENNICRGTNIVGISTKISNSAKSGLEYYGYYFKFI